MTLLTHEEGRRNLYMGNDAIVRGALEAGVKFAAGYPGTPSSEIIENLSKVAEEKDLYVEWSVNEKVALEVASSASFAGLKTMAVMKMPGLNVASDYLMHLSGSGTRAPMVLVTADDPGALSSGNEGDSRPYAKSMEVPLLEPGNFEEARAMTKWAFELSESIKNVVMLRTVTRLSHASGVVHTEKLEPANGEAHYHCDGFLLDPDTGVVMSTPVDFKHPMQRQKLKQAAELFETSPFNTYTGPESPELLIITGSICSLYCQEAVDLLGLTDRVGIFKLGTTWPLPEKLVETQLKRCDKVLFVEEILGFLEDEVKALAATLGETLGTKEFFGKTGGAMPEVGEMNPDKVMAGLCAALGMENPLARDEAYVKRAGEIAFFGAPHREATFCPGCPHRASYWSIHTALQMDNRKGFVCGDIGCYTLGLLPAGFSALKTLHAMGSGTGLASGFGKMASFGMEQPVVSVCGDSTFFHSIMPSLANAIHNESNMTLVVLDNSGTAMTGFQPHPGLTRHAMGDDAPRIDIPSVCRALGADVSVSDPFDVEKTRSILLELIDKKGVQVLVLRQSCALSPEKKGSKLFNVSVDETLCQGESCGCARICTRVFACPGLVWDKENNRSRIDNVMCSGCGVCVSVCPNGAITKEEVAP